MNEVERALVELGEALRVRGYRFTTITPESHRRVNARPENQLARDLYGALGWSRPFTREVVPAELLPLLERARALEELGGGRLRSRVRASTVGERLYFHSAFPTDDPDAVFLGPDTYRFVALLEREARPAKRVIDLGCGTGAGGLALAPFAEQVLLTDVNAQALSFARVNAALAGARHVEVRESDLLRDVDGSFDLIIANPPYLADEGGRTYRDGGDAWGTSLSVRIVREAWPRLAPGGRLIVYTGAPVVAGRDRLRSALEPILAASGGTWRYEELDPDVFGEELDKPAYAEVERIAVVSLTLTRASS